MENGGGIGGKVGRKVEEMREPERQRRFTTEPRSHGGKAWEKAEKCERWRGEKAGRRRLGGFAELVWQG